ncbi:PLASMODESMATA CALLOSE-BINDING PROTEIN 3-like [Mercurialis annua]|uniref:PLASMODESMATA CALLOSE-BINDING PROTEIN 3-like n=1 Tax=Mercurialis annua TaxID=3986 RepID=UPI00215E9F87|nr:PLASMODESMATA CALLOSE-BINDING PROTEIN 3-like [Mercurialis annua]
MAVLVFAFLMLVMTGHASCTWCVCKEMPNQVLQKTLDYACGAGADCGPIHSNNPCFQPDNVRAHCSYAVNSFFQKKNQAPGTCEFSGSATITTSDPSSSGCSYPATASAAGTSISTNPTTGTGTGTTNPSTTPTTKNPLNNTPTTTGPYSTTPSNGVFGNGVSPTGPGINTDFSDGGFRVPNTSFFSVIVTLFVSGLMLLWG